MAEGAERPAEVVGLGVSTLDVLTLVDEFPTDDSVVRAYDIQCDGGGPVATALAALGCLGKRGVMLDRLADDWRGKLIRDAFERAHVDPSALLTQPGAASPLATIQVRRRDGARAISYVPGSVSSLVASDLRFDLIERARYLHVNGRHWPACLAAAEHARRCGVKVSFDGGAQRYRDELRELLPLVDVCIVARQFAERATGCSEIEPALRSLQQLGPALVVMTAGVNGSWLLESERVAYQPAFESRSVVDTTGCGDAYHGGFLFALLEGAAAPEAARVGSAVASLVTRGLGGRSGLPDRATLSRLLA